MAAVIVAQEAEPFAQRGRLLVPHRGIKCVNPSKATESPSLTNSATASRNLTTSVTPKPNAHPRRIPFREPASGEGKASGLRLSARSNRLFTPGTPSALVLLAPPVILAAISAYVQYQVNAPDILSCYITARGTRMGDTQ